MTTQTITQPDPFTLRTGDLDLHFADAKIIQAVLVPTMLQWQLDGGGFFVETQDEAITPEFVPATFVTSQGQRRAGFGTQAFIAYPVSYRTFWQHKGGRDFSRTQVLAVLANGIWAVVTTKSTASKALSSAYRRTASGSPTICPVGGPAAAASAFRSAAALPGNRRAAHARVQRGHLRL